MVGTAYSTRLAIIWPLINDWRNSVRSLQRSRASPRWRRRVRPMRATWS